MRSANSSTTPRARRAGYSASMKTILRTVAEGLLEYETLSGEEVNALLRGETVHRDEPEPETGGERRSSMPLSDDPEPDAPPEAPPDIAAAPQPEN